MAPRNSPSGRSARLIWISMPGMSLASCSDSSETARSMAFGGERNGFRRGDLAFVIVEKRRVGLDAGYRSRPCRFPAALRRRAASRRTGMRHLSKSRFEVDRRSPRSSATRRIRKSAPGTPSASARRLRARDNSVSNIGCNLLLSLDAAVSRRCYCRAGAGAVMADWGTIASRKSRRMRSTASGAPAVSAGLRRLRAARRGARRACAAPAGRSFASSTSPGAR